VSINWKKRGEQLLASAESEDQALMHNFTHKRGRPVAFASLWSEVRCDCCPDRAMFVSRGYGRAVGDYYCRRCLRYATHFGDEF
jgi:hypothetical protein